MSTPARRTDVESVASPGPTGEPLLLVRGLEVTYGRGRRRQSRPAVEAIDLDVVVGRTTALVGESGSGKSTIAKALVGLHPPSAGELLLEGRPMIAANGRYRTEVLDDISMVFQDPFSSLNPALTVGTTLAESLGHRLKSMSRTDLEARTSAALQDVGLDASAAGRFPASFSGGQRQRIAIARALIREPRLIICDEPTSALDLSVQAQILNLLLELQAKRGVAYLFISHDMAVVEHVADTVAVISAGRIVESGPAARVLGQPEHRYTQRLLASVPKPIVQPGARTANVAAAREK